MSLGSILYAWDKDESNGSPGRIEITVQEKRIEGTHQYEFFVHKIDGGKISKKETSVLKTSLQADAFHGCMSIGHSPRSYLDTSMRPKRLYIKEGCKTNLEEYRISSNDLTEVILE